MKYCSTRGAVRGASFRDALFGGYTVDGGLFVPETVPKFPKDKIESWLKNKPTYPEVVFQVVRLFVAREEISDDVLEECVRKAYSKFDIPEVVGLKECKTRNGKMLKVAELYHGATHSFKDYALSLVGQLMSVFLQQQEDHVVVLVGTSGDTGSAAINAVEGLQGIDIIVLYPDGMISRVQELQMNSSKADNVHVFAVEGTADDIDIPIRKSFPDENLCSINSVNWSRLMIQIAHFVYLYIQTGESLDIFVPTGAAGNVSAGVLASLMGVPVKLFVATNVNDNVHDFLNKGELRLGGKVIPTPANAMDIRHAYNLERIIYLLSNSAEYTAHFMKNCEANPEIGATIDDELLKKIRAIIQESRIASTLDIHETIKWCWNVNKYMVCPHTATALAQLDSMSDREERPAIVVSTASPEKFPEVATALGISVKEWNGDRLLGKLQSGTQTRPNRSMTGNNISNWFELLQDEISRIRRKRL